MRYFLSILFIFSCFLAEGQLVEVFDAATGMPIEGVLVYSDNYSAETDAQGRVIIDKMEATGKIYFRHSSYLSFVSTKQKIVRQGGLVYLISVPVKLDEVVVSLSRWKQSKAEVPQSVIKLSQEKVMQFNPQTTADLLGTGGGIFIQKSQMGGGSPMIRGFAANRLLIVVDGIRMNNAIYRSGNLQNVISVDANSLENAEIILGPGSVIYGSDALGGVMSFNTLMPKLSTTGNTRTTGKAFTRISSANFEKTIHATVNLGNEKMAALISSTFTNFGDLRMGSNVRDKYLRKEYVVKNGFDGEDHIKKNSNELIQRYTGYSQFNILGKLRFRPSEKTDIILNANHSRSSDIFRYDRLIIYRNNHLRYGEWYYGPQVWSLFSGQLKMIPMASFADKINLQTAFQKYSESRYDRLLNNPVRNGRKECLSIYSMNLDLVKNINWQNDIFYGAESYYNYINSSGTEVNIGSGRSEAIPSRYPDNSEYGSFAGYLSYKFNWKKKIVVQAGTRYTYTWMKGKFDPRFGFPFEGFDMKNSAFIGNLGMVWHPDDSWQINVDLSTGFRSPNIDDVAKVFDSEPGNVIVPNPNLKPEYARNIEINLTRSFEKKSSISLSGFYTRLKDVMVRRDYVLNGKDSMRYNGTMSKVEALVNTDAAVVYGATLETGVYLTHQLRTRHDITVMKGEDSDGYAVRHVPPVFGSSHLLFEYHQWFADLYIVYNGKISYKNLAPSEREKNYLYASDKNGNPFSPSWVTLNLKGGYRIDKKLMLSGGIENILDTGYRPYSSGLVAPGFNVILSLEYRY